MSLFMVWVVLTLILWGPFTVAIFLYRAFAVSGGGPKDPDR